MTLNKVQIHMPLFEFNQTTLSSSQSPILVSKFKILNIVLQQGF